MMAFLATREEDLLRIKDEKEENTWMMINFLFFFFPVKKTDNDKDEG
jgi:hypothetical protein